MIVGIFKVVIYTLVIVGALIFFNSVDGIYERLCIASGCSYFVMRDVSG